MLIQKENIRRPSKTADMSFEAVHMTLLLTTLLCSLVVGLLFGFAVVVMPGISKFNDLDFLKAFKQMDGIIQDNQPLFMLRGLVP